MSEILLRNRFEELYGKAFIYHSPKGDQVERYRKIREAGKDFAFGIVKYRLESRMSSIETLQRYGNRMNLAKTFLDVIHELIPDDCNEYITAIEYTSKAIYELNVDHVRTAVMWANAAIACNE